MSLFSQTVNYGAIDPQIPNGAGGHIMFLHCEPKLGPGQWSVTGGTLYENTMEVWTPVAGSGGLTVASGGVLHVHRAMVLYGSSSVSGGSVTVDAEVLFDVGGLDPEGCPNETS